ncbi:MAG: threonylcarbamoyl-AMP synthase [Planctomycetes bacterium]|nr:threonylcarbamoyl-AMP synthase [Planctomycetota bacterium]
MPIVLPYDSESVNYAAGELRSGSVVAFATETVYGLGARTMDPQAIQKLYALKRRPADNPLIAHVLDVVSARPLVLDWPMEASLLASACWPGPLTMILRKAESVPRAATGGRDTIAIRSPRHPLARALLHAVGAPISAPSANRSGQVSPTTAEHVAQDFIDERDLLVLDGGPCTVGIESTVIDLTTPVPVVRRPGSVTVERLRELLGRVDVEHASIQGASPGTAARHYAPERPALLVDGHDLQRALDASPEPAAVIAFEGRTVPSPHLLVPMPRDAEQYAAILYGALRRADASGYARIVIERPEQSGGAWDAVTDRLARATA